MTEFAAPQQPAQQPQKWHQVSLVVSTDLIRRCLFRKESWRITENGQEDILLFSRSYWVLVEVNIKFRILSDAIKQVILEHLPE